jgi:hypothetical protein
MLQYRQLLGRHMEASSFFLCNQSRLEAELLLYALLLLGSRVFYFFLTFLTLHYGLFIES